MVMCPYLRTKLPLAFAPTKSALLETPPNHQKIIVENMP
jgi:hypothetical protein